jgi:hypothetical protein
MFLKVVCWQCNRFLGVKSRPRYSKLHHKTKSYQLSPNFLYRFSKRFFHYFPMNFTEAESQVETKILRVDPKSLKDEDLAYAVQLLKDGDVVAFPTETVYGLGANALNTSAAKKV